MLTRARVEYSPVERQVIDRMMTSTGEDTTVDPHALYRTLRRQDPVHLGDVFKEMGIRSLLGDTYAQTVYSVFRYDDIRSLMRDTAVYSVTCMAETSEKVFGRTILSMDPPVHTTHRSVMMEVFNRRNVAQWRDSIVRPVIHEYIETLMPRGGADILPTVLMQFPINVLYELMGIPSEDMARFHVLALRLLFIRDDPEDASDAGRELANEFRGLVESRMADLRDGRHGEDIISLILEANRRHGSVMTPADVVNELRLLLPAGTETVSRAAGSLLMALLTSPEQFEALRASPGMIANAVEEALRWEGAVQVEPRNTLCESMVGGVQIPEGVGLQLVLGSANRDEEQFHNPDVFDVTRSNARHHLGFGHGPHLCLGHQFARLEMATVVESVLDRMPRIRLDESYDPPHIQGVYRRSPSHLQVRWD
jgi:cytochrome P450